MLRTRKLVIIGGCGHVGLPLGIVFANCGINVVLLDVSAERIAAVNSGRTPFMEDAAEEHLKAVIGKTLVATSDSSCLKTADAAIAVVGTPVDEHLNPTVTELYRNIDSRHVEAALHQSDLANLRAQLPGDILHYVRCLVQKVGFNINDLGLLAKLRFDTGRIY